MKTCCVFSLIMPRRYSRQNSNRPFFQHVHLSLASGDAAAVDPKTMPYHSDLHWHTSTDSRRIFRCAPPVATATAVPPPAQLGRRSASRIRLSHYRSALFLCVCDQLEICSTVATIFSSRPNRVALFAWARTPTCLLSSSTTGFVAPDLVGRRSRTRCNSPPWRHVSGLSLRSPRPLWPFDRDAPLPWIPRSRSVIISHQDPSAPTLADRHGANIPLRFPSSPPSRQLVRRNTAGWFSVMTSSHSIDRVFSSEERYVGGQRLLASHRPTSND